MEDLGYTWIADVSISGGYAGQNKGANPLITTPQTGLATGSHIADYYYSDSNAKNPDGSWGNNQNSSQVHYTIKDEWTASVDSDNVVTIRLTTTVQKIERTFFSGNPNLTITNGRDISLSRTANGASLWTLNGDSIVRYRVLGTNIHLASETIVLAPGGSANRQPSVWIRNHTAGTPLDPYPGGLYTDYIQAGVTFQNNLPADYRPGATFNGLSWRCNNNSGGACHVYTGSSWQECRTQDWPTGTGNPPLGYSGSFKNQAKIPNQ